MIKMIKHKSASFILRIKNKQTTFFPLPPIFSIFHSFNLYVSYYIFLKQIKKKQIHTYFSITDKVTIIIKKIKNSFIQIKN